MWIARIVGIAFACNAILFLVLDDDNGAFMRHRLQFSPNGWSGRLQMCFMFRRTFLPIVFRCFPLCRITYSNVRSRGGNNVNSLSINGAFPVDPDWDKIVWDICTCMPWLPVRCSRLRSFFSRSSPLVWTFLEVYFRPISDFLVALDGLSMIIFALFENSVDPFASPAARSYVSRLRMCWLLRQRVSA
jgi:hypothetical protein